MSRITMFKKEWLKNLVVIDKPMSKVEIEVTSNVTERHRINATEPGKSDKYIVNLKAVPKDKYDELVALFKDRDEVPIEETNGLFLTGAIWVGENEKPYLPMKGEKLLCNIEFVEDRAGDQVLRVTNTQPQPAATAAKFDFEGAFEQAPATGREIAQGAGGRAAR